MSNNSNAVPKFRDINISIPANQLVDPKGPWSALGITKSCISCDFFDEKKELCNKYGSRPPARVIAFSCESYKDDNCIPF